MSEAPIRILAENRAAADALPGPLKSAFGQMSIHVAGYEVRPVVAYDFVLFEHLNSFVHRQILETMQTPEGQQPEEVTPTKQEAWDLVWQLTRTAKEADAVFQAGGTKAIQQASREAFPMVLHDAVINQVIAAAMQQIKRYMETMIRYGAGEDTGGNGKTTFFQEAGASVTASAGGSST